MGYSLFNAVSRCSNGSSTRIPWGVGISLGLLVQQPAAVCQCNRSVDVFDCTENHLH
jgi:hypothetical protein